MKEFSLIDVWFFASAVSSMLVGLLVHDYIVDDPSIDSGFYLTSLFIGATAAAIAILRIILIKTKSTLQAFDLSSVEDSQQSLSLELREISISQNQETVNSGSYKK